MKKIIFFNPAVASMNMGDHIIFDGAEKVVKDLFPLAFYIEVSTHLPISNKYMDMIADSDYKFVCGSNLLKADMLFGFRQWDISYTNSNHIKPVVLLGCGWWQYQKKIDLYSNKLLHNLLDSKFIHSVRDNYTVEKLNSIGIKNVINTGCPTMWKLDEAHCKEIRKDKANNVITTLTDYKPDILKDNKMLSILSKNYNKVYVWMQGYKDFDYYKELKKNENIILIPPSIESYDKILEEKDIEYVGTRLHGGIRALQKKKRTLIVAVDNRAIEKQKDFNLNVLKRENIEELEECILGEHETKITLNKNEINQFLKQFKEK